MKRNRQCQCNKHGRRNKGKLNFGRGDGRNQMDSPHRAWNKFRWYLVEYIQLMILGLVAAVLVHFGVVVMVVQYYWC